MMKKTYAKFYLVEIDPSLLQRVTIWLARCWPTYYTLDKYMVVEAKFETMITNDSCFVAVSCLVVFCCWKLNYSSFHISPFFPVSSISFSKVQIMITTTSRRPPAYTNFIGTNRKLNLKKSFEKRGYFWKNVCWNGRRELRKLFLENSENDTFYKSTTASVGNTVITNHHSTFFFGHSYLPVKIHGCCVPIERICGIGISEELREEALKNIWEII